MEFDSFNNLSFVLVKLKRKGLSMEKTIIVEKEIVMCDYCGKEMGADNNGQIPRCEIHQSCVIKIVREKLFFKK